MKKSKGSEKIRVLHILTDLSAGGAQMLVKNLMFSYDRNRFDLAICSLFPKGETIIEQQLEGVGNIFYLDKKLGPDPKILFRLYRLLKQFRPHVVHTHLYISRYALIPSLICKIPVKMHTFHNPAEKEVEKIGKIISWIAFNWLNIQPIALSPAISNSVGNLYKRQNVPYIYNGIPTKDYIRNDDVRKMVRHSLNLSDDILGLITVGRFSPQKNHALMIEAFSKVHAQNKNSMLIMVGDGDLKPKIESMVRANNLSDYVQFLGLRKDIPELLAAADIFVLSSDWEGMPLVIIEAMAAGKPVVATAVGGVPDMITDQASGFLVKPNDAEAMAQIILKLANDKALASKIGEVGRKIAQDRFDVSMAAREYEKKYLERLSLS
jgi:glycosyltransferase involved in cell wall biosynthesis